MDRIAIITPRNKDLETYLRSNMDVDTICFDDIYRLEERLEISPLRVDTLLIRDDGLRDNRYDSLKINEAGNLLLTILQRPLFEVDKVVYLNNTPNKAHREMMEFIQSSKKINVEVIISTQDTFQALMIKQLLLKSNLDFGELNLSYKHVVKKKRGKLGTKSKYLSKFETDKAVVLEYNSYNADIVTSKKQLVKAVGKVNVDAPVEKLTPVEGLEIPLTNEDVTPKVDKTTVVAVVGESKSGCTTTSMILGASGSVYHKTLVVDMNYDNLGLTYLVEKTLLPEEVNEIRMSKLIETGQGAKVLREEMYDSSNLHILTLDLPAKKIMTKGQYGFFILNIINLVKNNYAYIILDIPIEDLHEYTGIANKLDHIILCTPPYMNNIMSMFHKIRESPIVNIPLYNETEGLELTKIVCLRTRVFSTVNAGIKPITKEVFDTYAKAIIKRTMKVTGIYSYTAKNYIDTVLFQQLFLGDSR